MIYSDEFSPYRMLHHTSTVLEVNIESTMKLRINDQKTSDVRNDKKNDNKRSTTTNSFEKKTT